MNKTLIGSLAAIPFATAGIFAFTDFASAATLTGSIGLTGGTEITETSTTTTINFLNEKVEQATGDFSSLLHSTTLSVSNLVLTKGTDFPPFGTTYSNSAITSFIDFGFVNLGSIGSGNLTFNLDAGATFLRSTVGSTTIYSNPGGVTGVFKFNGNSFATGAVQSSISKSSSTFQITMETDKLPVSVPEPATLLGLSVVGAALATSRRQKTVKS